MSVPVPKRATYDDLYKLPENMTGEIIEGELHVSPRPHYRHSNAVGAVQSELKPPYQFKKGGGPGGWIILIETEVMLGDNLLVPDLAGWKKERLPKLPKKNWTTVPPDWVCEILSPNTKGYDRIKKMPIYSRFEVKHAWLVDPVDRTLEVYQLDDSRCWRAIGYYGENDLARAEPFPEVELNLADLWGEEEES